MKFRLTKQEKHWILYDVGNSAFILMVSTIFPIYFNSLAGSGGLSSEQYLSVWGYAASVCTLFVALTSPFLGKFADRIGRRKPLFIALVAVGALLCAFLGLAGEWLAFLIMFCAAKICCSESIIIYDSMLSEITTEERMNTVSSQGYAWGYIGSCIPFVVCLGLVLGGEYIGISTGTAMTVSFVIIGAWWLIVTVPLMKNYRQKDGTERIENPFSGLSSTLKEISGNRQALLFLIAFFFYIDGVYTIIDMATAYGSALGFDSTGLLLALLFTQFVAFPSSVIIGRLSQNVSAQRLITVCIAAYLGISVFAIFMTQQFEFWILAGAVGMFQGGIQALSRSYYAKIIPQGKSGEYFGIMDICGKGASFLGTAVVSLVTSLTGSANLGISGIVVFLIAGLVVFRLSCRTDKMRKVPEIIGSQESV